MKDKRIEHLLSITVAVLLLAMNVLIINYQRIHNTRYHNETSISAVWNSTPINK